ncbi:MAG: serine/threonine protein kinase [Candidatus Competibacteraceae bacterium]|nr:MAG: serine/threonine protein kinase [Candidatus Competibacteraceae bacterium]
MQTQLRRYVIGEKLGQGGFGITYRGFDLKLKMEVAIKEYFPSDFANRADDRKTLVLLSPENTELFDYGLRASTEEAHTLAKLQHPNLVRVLNLFEMNATAYLVMDYYEGETLHDYLVRQPGRKLPWREAIQVLLPVLDGLQAVHDQGFLHRDIKPRNLYRTHQGQIILLDFGAARQVVSDRGHSIAIYTNGYAAYEQHTQGEQGPWTDVYGAAATLYFLLTGQTPPAADARAMDDALKPPRHHVPELPPASRQHPAPRPGGDLGTTPAIHPGTQATTRNRAGDGGKKTLFERARSAQATQEIERTGRRDCFVVGNSGVGYMAGLFQRDHTARSTDTDHCPHRRACAPTASSGQGHSGGLQRATGSDDSGEQRLAGFGAARLRTPRGAGYGRGDPGGLSAAPGIGLDYGGATQRCGDPVGAGPAAGEHDPAGRRIAAGGGT